jgi:hypothetical protein
LAKTKDPQTILVTCEELYHTRDKFKSCSEELLWQLGESFVNWEELKGHEDYYLENLYSYLGKLSSKRVLEALERSDKKFTISLHKAASGFTESPDLLESLSLLLSWCGSDSFRKAMFSQEALGLMIENPKVLDFVEGIVFDSKNKRTLQAISELLRKVQVSNKVLDVIEKIVIKSRGVPIVTQNLYSPFIEGSYSATVGTVPPELIVKRDLVEDRLNKSQNILLTGFYKNVLRHLNSEVERWLKGKERLLDS